MNYIGVRCTSPTVSNLVSLVISLFTVPYVDLSTDLDGLAMYGIYTTLIGVGPYASPVNSPVQSQISKRSIIGKRLTFVCHELFMHVCLTFTQTHDMPLYLTFPSIFYFVQLSNICS